MNKTLLYGITTIIAGIVVAATLWNFSAVAEIPSKYHSKEDHQIFINQNEQDHRDIKERLNNIYDILIEHERKRVVREDGP